MQKDELTDSTLDSWSNGAGVNKHMTQILLKQSVWAENIISGGVEMIYERYISLR